MRRVSIVVDNHDYEAFVAEAVDSALAQTWPATEVIVVDDGSTDRSLEVLRGYGARIQLVEKPNGGQASAVNAGFARSTGEIVLFLDADDRLHPEAVERVALAWDDVVAKVHFPLRIVDAQGRPTGALSPDARPLPRGDLRPQLLRTGVYRSPPMSGNAYARRVLERLLPMPESEWRLHADSWLWLLAALHGDVRALDEPLADYRVHGRNAFHRDRPDPEALRDEVRQDRLREQVVREAALALGLEPARDLAAANPHRTGLRLAGAAIDALPRGRLARQGLAAAWRAPDRTFRQRVAFAAWCAAVGTLPAPLARRVAWWHPVPATRPWRR